jgi:hypothetical protein
MQAVHVASASSVKELLIVMQIEAIEVDTLTAFNLFDAQYHAAPQFKGFASTGLKNLL